ncbi:MAG: hypothetical protein WC312_03765 [Candidatus Omnitrophota bacterium]
MKIGYFVLTAIIAGMLSIFFWGTFNKAEQALALGNENTRNISVMQECIRGINKSLEKIEINVEKIVRQMP